MQASVSGSATQGCSWGLRSVVLFTQKRRRANERLHSGPRQWDITATSRSPDPGRDGFVILGGGQHEHKSV